ncbi:hypothetical protein [Clostridium septicum]|uniref:Uncharacterized protein n=1 Tax=Clostridium septicum TaxID=1504 RepID=A0A9N7PLJ7_CLOSE|nr:hypothetical protein [Clostridium septicum]AYE34786.1 hypothetical protein CP523_10440 [Clostridium septicum]QAS60181.1 hypothetical protein EI377_05215 [Clostridium septicum]UEC20568.1 hypothetical protein LK444_14390 [Clostridium septicum]USS01379.1 hypothetical protein NH397_02785 [Clostridium septicum]
MRAVNAKVIARRQNGVDVKFSNGMRDFIASIDKENLTIEDIKNYSVNVKVYSIIRNCCNAYPANVLELGTSKSDDEEIKDLLDKIVDMVGYTI